MMKKEGIILIYRDNIGIIKFDESEYCHFRINNLSRHNTRLPKKGDKVKFKLSTKSNPLVYEARRIRIIQE